MSILSSRAGQMPSISLNEAALKKGEKRQATSSSGFWKELANDPRVKFY